MTSWSRNSSTLSPWENTSLQGSLIKEWQYQLVWSLATRLQKKNESTKNEEEILVVELSKTKEEGEVIASLQYLSSLSSIYVMLQLPNKMWSALTQTLKNPTLYATKIKRAKDLIMKATIVQHVMWPSPSLMKTFS